VQKTGHRLPAAHDGGQRLKPRHLLILLVLCASIAGLVVGTRVWGWKTPQLGKAAFGRQRLPRRRHR